MLSLPFNTYPPLTLATTSHNTTLSHFRHNLRARLGKDEDCRGVVCAQLSSLSLGPVFSPHPPFDPDQQPTLCSLDPCGCFPPTIDLLCGMCISDCCVVRVLVQYMYGMPVEMKLHTGCCVMYCSGRVPFASSCMLAKQHIMNTMDSLSRYQEWSKRQNGDL